MKKPDKRETLNLFFSAFLIIAFIVCAHFFSQFANNLDYPFNNLVSIMLYIVFGLLLFYATRVGDGKAVKRFSPVTLIVMVVPALYIFIASIADFMPLHDIVAPNGGVSIISILAGVAMGYGIPYSFFSGFELKNDEDEAEEPDDQILEGGIEADLLESEQPEQETEPENQEAQDAEQAQEPEQDSDVQTEEPAAEPSAEATEE